MADLPNNPISRKEQYLSKAAGQSTELPPYPITREEHYLAKIAEGGGGGGAFNVNFDFDSNNNVVADKTHNEIIAAFDAGNLVLGHLNFFGDPLVFVAYSYDSDGIKFSCNHFGVSKDSSGNGAAFGYFVLLKPDESTVAGRFSYTTTSWMFL